MVSVLYNPDYFRRERLDALYGGRILIFAPSPESLAFAAHARSMIEQAFEGLEPRRAQYDIDVHEFVRRFAPLKREFIHHPASMVAIRSLMQHLDGDAEDTYLDVPRLRVATSDGYLTSGVAYAHHPHRDTWYSAPLAQINWWMPIYDFPAGAGMAFHPRYWSEGVPNTSGDFNYYAWNTQGRADAHKHVTSDTRVQPHAVVPLELEPAVEYVVPAGGLIAFSAAQMHSTVPNNSGVSRWSVDFRTVACSDLRAGRAAPNVDSSPTGTSLRDFVRMRDFAPMPDDVVAAYDVGGPAAAGLVFQPEEVAR